MPYPEPWERWEVIKKARRLVARGNPEQAPQEKTDFRPKSADDILLIDMSGDQGDGLEPWDRIQTWAEEGLADKGKLPGFIRGIGTVPTHRIFPGRPED